MTSARRAQQERRRIDGSAGDHYYVRSIRLHGAVTVAHHHLLHFRAGRVCIETLYEGMCHELDVWIRKRRVNADHLRIGLGVHQTREAVAGTAADARAGLRPRLIEQQAKWEWERCPARPP